MGRVHRVQDRHRIPWNWSGRGFKPHSVGAGEKLGPLQEQQVLLPAEPFL